MAVVMGDCHSSAVTREPAVAHAGGVKVNAFPLHVYSLMAPLKPFRFMRSSWVLSGPWAFSGLSPLEPCLFQELGEGHRILKGLLLHVFSLQAL